MKPSAIILGLALALGTFAPATSMATSLVDMSDAQMVDASDYVVEGTVTEVWVEFDDNDAIWTRAKIQVSRTFKGKDAPAELIVDTMGGEIDDEVLMVPASARFSEGEKVILFLAEIKQGTRLTPVAMHRGKYTIRRAPGDTERYVTRWRPKDGVPYDHRFIPHPAHEHRKTAVEVRDNIEQRLVTGWDGKPIPGISLEKLQQINTAEYRRVRQ